MALFNKIFSTSRKKIDTKCDDNVNNICSQLFAFTKDQVRVVLYRECDFRGRKLLFDSSSVEKIRLTRRGNDDGEPIKSQEKFTETSDAFGYVYMKPKSDANQLGEIVFGSVAMSFRGTTYKIHRFVEPSRLMCTQVFPSPRKSTGRRSLPMHSCTHHSSTTTTSSFDDSGTSSATSFSEHLSVSSTASDTLLVCRKNRSVPLDVPNNAATCDDIPKVTIDSGYSCDDRLCSSFGSGPPSFPVLDVADNKSTFFSCGSLYKRWLRSANNSLEHSSSSLNNYGSNSGDELYPKHQHNRRASKLGLAVIIQLTAGEEECLEKFLMEHAALVESMVWRARQGTETAYLRPNNFLSLMLDVYEHVSRWLVDFLSGPYLNGNMWLTLNCDSNNSSIKFSEAKTSLTNRDCRPLTSNGHGDANVDLSSLLMLTRLFKNNGNEHQACAANKNNQTAATFVRDLCELLETIDVKHTNFFMSTLITAVLTHHLGWVTTVMPSLNGVDSEQKNCPGNPLWGQLIDLYGATGYPTKVCHTIVTGGCENKSDLIPKILNTLTYFIRCNRITRIAARRERKCDENAIAGTICTTNACIPKENFKKYEDHVKQMMMMKPSPDDSGNCSNAKRDANVNEDLLAIRNSNKTSVGGGLKKSHTFVQQLNAAESDDRKLFDKVAHMGFDAIDGFNKSQINENIHNLCRVSTDAILKHVRSNDKSNLVGIKEASDEIKRVFQPKEAEDEDDDKVVFLLGDNEKLIGLNKEKCESTTFEDDFKASIFKDSDFACANNDGYPMKPSTSCALLNVLDADEKPPCAASGKDCGRSQSVPREEPEAKPKKPDAAKYRYSGVKFNFQQYPQIFTNYMKSKNIELSSLAFSDKEIDSEKLMANFDYFNTEPDLEDVEALETPSNATELEFSNEMMDDEVSSGEKRAERRTMNGSDCNANRTDVQIIKFPMPEFCELRPDAGLGYTSSLMRGLNDHYIPDMVLQGVSLPKADWEASLKRDLVLSTRHPFLDQQVDEAVAIIANKDTWEVLLMSSHKYVVDKGNSTGVRVGMSQLVANMLETLLHLWKLHTPPERCLMHIEQKLQELFLRSKALAQLLLATEFCSMELLTSTLQLEINDVPLIMAIASTHTPQIAQKYGLSFQ